MRILIAAFLLFLLGNGSAQAAEFTYLGSRSVEQLNDILTHERTAFLPPEHLSKAYRWPTVTSARYAVDLYKVGYDSTIPELNNRPTRSYGLIALPKGTGKTTLPVISYQHGTVYGKYEVPSYAFVKTNPSGYSQYDGAYETRLMVAQFAGQGYAVIAPDYFGMGDSTEPEGYMVKASAQRACLGMYDAAMEFLGKQGLRQEQLFLGGWSLGGLVTTGFLEALEARGTPVTAAFTASSPNDPLAALTGMIYHPRKIDAPWSNTILALTAFSYENYYQQPGLAATVIRPEYYALFKQIYTRNYANPEEFAAEFGKLLKNPVPFKSYFLDAYSDPAYLANSPYGRLLAGAETYRQLFRTPLRIYYGMEDEGIAQPVGLLGAHYQEAMGNESVETMKVAGGNHRATFLTAVSTSGRWLARFRKH
jgi:pimeloyl-ACP methyl ester carboxylesterase